MEDERIWYVYSWNYDNPSNLLYEAWYSKERAMQEVDEILSRGDDWDAYASPEPPDEIVPTW